MVLRALTVGLLAAALLTPPVASAQAPTKELQATATVQARVQLTRITSDRASGTVRFTGRLRDGTPAVGERAPSSSRAPGQQPDSAPAVGARSSSTPPCAAPMPRGAGLLSH
ncbi:MAG: hypothetical protein IPG68_13750 [Micrococcales bacterium]|nr:hypothetical protein [Micrococcales bacterium]